MNQQLQNTLAGLESYPQLQAALAIGALILVAWLANFVVKRGLLRGIYRLFQTIPESRQLIGPDNAIINRLANIVPALVVSLGIALVPGLPEGVVAVVRNVAGAFIVLTTALAIGNLLNVINDIYERRPDAHKRPVKGYIQVIKICVYAIAAILVIAALVDRSPLILLSGLGAMAAVLMLIFQDTLLSLVASVQISSNDIIRVGDWVEMPQLNADGAVIDIALHTVKVQNWDKTITVIPTKRFMTDPFKNWRGMYDSGGRRIKRSIMIDQHSIGFLEPDQIAKLRRFRLLRRYLEEKQKEIDAWNQTLAEAGKEPVNTRRITNIGTFRAYVDQYLRSHGGIHQEMTLMVRQLSPTPEGLPLELYCFTNSTAWVDYEGVQADIFDHLLAIMPEFGLQVYQQPSGLDWRKMNLARAS